jgi:hypothetical protein
MDASADKSINCRTKALPFDDEATRHAELTFYRFLGMKSASADVG